MATCVMCLSRAATKQCGGGCRDSPAYCDHVCQQLHWRECHSKVCAFKAETHFEARTKRLRTGELVEVASDADSGDDEDFVPPDEEEDEDMVDVDFDEEDDKDEDGPALKKRRVILVEVARQIQNDMHLVGDVIGEILKLLPLKPISLFARLLKLREVGKFMETLIYRAMLEMDLVPMVFPMIAVPRAASEVEATIRDLVARIDRVTATFMEHVLLPRTVMIKEHRDFVKVRPSMAFFLVSRSVTGALRTHSRWKLGAHYADVVKERLHWYSLFPSPIGRNYTYYMERLHNTRVPSERKQLDRATNMLSVALATGENIRWSFGHYLFELCLSMHAFPDLNGVALWIVKLKSQRGQPDMITGDPASTPVLPHELNLEVALFRKQPIVYPTNGL